MEAAQPDGVTVRSPKCALARGECVQIVVAQTVSLRKVGPVSACIAQKAVVGRDPEVSVGREQDVAVKQVRGHAGHGYSVKHQPRSRRIHRRMRPITAAVTHNP